MDQTSVSHNTYRNWATEYSATEEHRAWVPFKLTEAESMKEFREKEIYPGTTTSQSHVAERLFCVDPYEDDYCIEPLLVCPDPCLDSLRVAGMKAVDQRDPVPLSCSFYGYKNVIFRLRSCLLYMGEAQPEVYIPMTFINRIVDDMSYRDVSLSVSRRMLCGNYYRLVPTGQDIELIRKIYDSSPKFVAIDNCISASHPDRCHVAHVSVITSMEMVQRRRYVTSSSGRRGLTIREPRRLRMYAYGVGTIR